MLVISHSVETIPDGMVAFVGVGVLDFDSHKNSCTKPFKVGDGVVPRMVVTTCSRLGEFVDATTSCKAGVRVRIQTRYIRELPYDYRKRHQGWGWRRHHDGGALTQRALPGHLVLEQRARQTDKSLECGQHYIEYCVLYNQQGAIRRNVRHRYNLNRVRYRKN